jgi:hypothetical protein
MAFQCLTEEIAGYITKTYTGGVNVPQAIEDQRLPTILQPQDLTSEQEQSESLKRYGRIKSYSMLPDSPNVRKTYRVL